MTIRRRLTLWYSGMLALIIVIFAVIVMGISRVAILQTIDGVLRNTAEDVLSRMAVVPVSEFGENQQEILFYAEDAFLAPGFALQVWRTHVDGERLQVPTLVRSSTDLLGLNTPLDRNGLTASTTGYISTNINNVASRIISQPITLPNGEAIGFIQIATPISTVSQANDALFMVLLITGVITLGVSIIVGSWIAARALEPINVITRAASSITKAEDLSTRLEWDGPMDELGRLTEVFNDAMERLDTLFEVQQRFIGDVSHELRTPLTSVLGNLELITRYGVDQSSLEAIQREAGRMTRMVNDLLLLTRADFGEMDIDFYPIDLDTVALDVYEQALQMSKARDLHIKLKRVEPVRVESNVDRAKQLMLNLVSNAIKFTGAGGTVSLAVYPEGDEAVIEVSDTGIGISDADLNRIFDRFFQADASRVHRDDADGAGLGLSIARWIVDIHGGSIDVQSKLGEGSKFIVRLPCEIPSDSNGNSLHVVSHRIGSYTIKARSKRAETENHLQS